MGSSWNVSISDYTIYNIQYIYPIIHPVVFENGPEKNSGPFILINFWLYCCCWKGLTDVLQNSWSFCQSHWHVLLHGVAVVVVELFLPLGLVCPLVYCVWAVEERCGRDFQLGTHAMWLGWHGLRTFTVNCHRSWGSWGHNSNLIGKATDHLHPTSRKQSQTILIIH